MSACDISTLTAEAVARLCFEKYKELPKTGKPTDTQWTVLAGVVLHNSSKNLNRVVSLGLGTKCIGANKLCKNGWIINDSHAEVLVRRGLLRFIYQEIKNCQLGTDSNTIFVWNEENSVFCLKTEYTFHFFCTQAPCGDACIVECFENETPAKRAKLSSNSEDIGAILTTTPVYTGAKLFVDCDKNDDCMAQTIGALRIKPGKGDRTLSMSCSDKLSKWSIIGVQGALLDLLLKEPIYFESLNFCSCANQAAIERAIYARWKPKLIENLLPYSKYKQKEPTINICNEHICFENAPTAKRKQPLPTGIVWCNIPEQFHACEIIVNGKRQGCTKKALQTAQAAVLISKFNLAKEFISILKNEERLMHKFITREELSNLRYKDIKNMATDYQAAWNYLSTKCFGQWTKKPTDLYDFTVEAFHTVAKQN